MFFARRDFLGNGFLVRVLRLQAFFFLAPTVLFLETLGFGFFLRLTLHLFDLFLSLALGFLRLGEYSLFRLAFCTLDRFLGFAARFLELALVLGFRL